MAEAEEAGELTSRLALARIMAAAFAAALLVRFLYLAAFRESPFFHVPLADAAWHDAWARALVSGEGGMDGRAFFRAPLYPCWLSVLYRLGAGPFAVRAIQAVVGASAAAALAGAGVRFRGRGTGLAAGLLAALYGPLVFFDGELLIPNLLVALLSWCLFFASGRPGKRSAAVSGALLGLAVAARPNALVLIPAVLVLWGFGRGWRSRAALFLALSLLPAAWVTGANARAERGFVFVASQGGLNFYAGNHAGASGRSIRIPELRDEVSWRELVGEAREVAERAVGRGLSSEEVSSWWLYRGLDWIRENPADAAGLTARKAYYLANAFEISSNRDLYLERPGILRLLLWKTPFLGFPWGIVFPLAVMGFTASVRRKRNSLRISNPGESVPAGAGSGSGLASPDATPSGDAGGGARARRFAAGLGAWVLLYGLSILPFFVTARFRMGMVPALLLLAGAALARPRALRSPPVLIAGAVALVLANTSGFGVRGENPALELSRLAEAALHTGRTEEGVHALERARGLDPSSITVAAMLADAYAEEGRFAEAVPLYEEVAGRRERDAFVRVRLGSALLELGRFAEAARVLEAAVRLDPDDAAGWRCLGIAAAGAGNPARAGEAYARAIALSPGDPDLVLRLAELHRKEGDLDRAAEVLERGVERNPDSVELRYELARADLDLGREERARKEVEALLELAPEHEGGLRLRERLEEER